jgi:hypothetical protein
MLVKSFLIGMREGEELKAPRHASAAATRDSNLPYSWHLVNAQASLWLRRSRAVAGSVGLFQLKDIYSTYL